MDQNASKAILCSFKDERATILNLTELASGLRHIRARRTNPLALRVPRTGTSLPNAIARPSLIAG